MSEPAVLSAGEVVHVRTPLLDRCEGDLHHTLELDIDVLMKLIRDA
jgi:hypothetical protein